MKKLICALVACAMVGSGAFVVAENIDLEGIKCVVAPRDAKAATATKYKEGEVFFCCNNCKGKFEKDPKQFTASANKQLVATEQYEQKACPISGRDLNPETALKVAGTEVTFCCMNCRGKVADAEEKEQVEMVFGEKAFEKAKFEKKKKKDS